MSSLNVGEQVLILGDVNASGHGHRADKLAHDEAAVFRARVSVGVYRILVHNLCVLAGPLLKARYRVTPVDEGESAPWVAEEERLGASLDPTKRSSLEIYVHLKTDALLEVIAFNTGSLFRGCKASLLVARVMGDKYDSALAYHVLECRRRKRSELVKSDMETPAVLSQTEPKPLISKEAQLEAKYQAGEDAIATELISPPPPLSPASPIPVAPPMFPPPPPSPHENIAPQRPANRADLLNEINKGGFKLKPPPKDQLQQPKPAAAAAALPLGVSLDELAYRLHLRFNDAKHECPACTRFKKSAGLA